MRAYGAPDEVIEVKRAEWLAAQPPFEPTEIYPENVEAFQVFLTLTPQWEFPGMNGGRTTVSFVEVESCIRLMRVARRADCFRRVRLLIGAAREVFIEQQRREAARERIPSRHRH